MTEDVKELIKWANNIIGRLEDCMDREINNPKDPLSWFGTPEDQYALWYLKEAIKEVEKNNE